MRYNVNEAMKLIGLISECTNVNFGVTCRYLVMLQVLSFRLYRRQMVCRWSVTCRQTFCHVRLTLPRYHSVHSCIIHAVGYVLILLLYYYYQGQLSLPGSVNEYQLRLGRQRQVWFIPLADERGVWNVQVKL